MNGDLAVVVPDKDIEMVVRGLLTRTVAIGCRPLAGYEIRTHTDRDSGVFHRGPALLGLYARTHRHGLLMIDLAWDGCPQPSARDLEVDLEDRCRSRWGERAACVALDPEIEAWVWTRSPHVAEALGWEEGPDSLREWLHQRGLWEAGANKPLDPKAAMKAALHEKRRPWSSAIFREVAGKATWRNCEDRSFLRLLELLRGWFPLHST